MKLNYNSSEYTVESVVANLYNITGNGVRIHFECEWKNGSYFKIKSVTKNGKCYQASRFLIKYIPLVREATFKVWQENGLYDYSSNEMVLYNQGQEFGKWLGRKLNIRR